MNTLKDKLTYMANTYNIDKDIDYITEKMEEHYNLRKFELHIIKPKVKYLTIGAVIPGQYSSFLPSILTDEQYGALFISKFNKLGFQDSDIEIKREDNKEYSSYDIILRW